MTAVLAPAAFDVCGPLPTGTTVLEASAGTGKTFTIAALAARYVAEGVRDAAGADARHVRPRGHHRAARAGAGAAAGRAARARRSRRGPRRGGDAVHALLADAPDAEVALRRARLVHALATFDAATIATTHQFCRQMLAGLGRGGGRRSGRGVRRVGRGPARRGRRRLLRAQVRRPGGRAAAVRPRRPRWSWPAPPSTTGRPGWSRAAAEPGVGRGHPLPVRRGRARRGRAAQAGAARLHLRRHAHPPRRRAAPLTRSRGPAAGALPGGAGRRVPGHRPRAVVDPAPRVPRAHHAGADRRPQAGDLRLPRRRRRHLPGGHARGRRGTPRSPINHRSDAAAARRAGARCSTAPRSATSGSSCTRSRRRTPGGGCAARPSDAPVRVRVAARAGPAHAAAARRAARRAGPRAGRRRPRRRRRRAARQRGDGRRRAGAARRRRGARAHQRAGRHGARGARRRGRARGGDGHGERLRHPGRGRLAHAAGGPRAAPAGPAAGRRAHLLPRAHRRGAVRAAGGRPARRAGRHRPALGRGAARARGGGAARGGHHRHRRCPPACSPAPTASGGSPICGTSRRRCTPSPSTAHLGPGALVEWLRRRIAEAGGRRRAGAQQAAGVRRRRRADHHHPPQQGPGVPGRLRAVRVGPQRARSRTCRCCTTAPSGCATSAGRPARASASAARRTGPRRPARTSGCSTWRSPARSARSSLWWVPSTTTAASPVHRLLIGRPAPGTEPAGELPRAVRRGGVGGAAPGSRRRCWPSSGSRDVRPPDGPVHAARGAARRARGGRVHPLARPAWRRTSYSALTAGAGHRAAGVTSEPEAPGVQDEPEARRTDDRERARTGLGEIAPSRRRARAVPSPWPTCRRARRSARSCTPCSRSPTSPRPTCRPSSPPAAPSSSSTTPCPASTADALADALVPVARTPLGPVADDLRLADVAPADRLAELEFELPLGGGDHAAPQPPRCSARSPRCCAPTSPPTTRSRATPTSWPRRRSPTSRCAATSPAASTPCCGCPAPASSSSTTRPTGSGPSGRAADRRRTTPRSASPPR